MKEMNHLKSKLADGRITRRDFIRSAIALGIATPTAMSLSSAVLAATPKAIALRIKSRRVMRPSASSI